MFLSNGIKALFPLSLAAKLAILYAVTTFSVLLVASGFLYWSILGHLEREHQNLLVVKITDLRQYFKTSTVFGNTLHDLIDTEHHYSQMPHSSAIHPGIPHHVLVRILNEQRDLLVQSDAMMKLPTSLEFPHVENLDEIKIIKIRLGQNQRYLLGSAWAATISEGQPRKLLLHVVLPLAQDETLLSEYQQTLAGVLLFGVIASALAGFWITRRGLLPLRQITQTVQNINAQQLNEHVGSEQWPREIGVLARAFDEMLTRLHKSFGQLSQFSADLAHELRTPVNNLMGVAEVALSRNRDAEEYRYALESSIEECARIARMIDELLFLARAEDPKTEINCQWLTIKDEFEAIKLFYESIASEKKINIISRVSQFSVYADSSLLRRALSNLVSNALRYTPENGQIRLSAIGLENRTVRITVTDTGEGISKTLLPQIFDRFFRADKSRHRSSQNSGLGLAIVKSIVDLHGGDISVISALQQGVQVQMNFPLPIKNQGK